MTLVLKAHQLLQAIAFIGDDVNDFELKLSFKELQDGTYVWLTDAPERGSAKLEDVIPDSLATEILGCDEPRVVVASPQLELNFDEFAEPMMYDNMATRA